MNYENIKCGDIDGRKDSENLLGALSTNQDFFYLESGHEEYIANNKPIEVFVSEDIYVDYNNQIFIGKNGAVADAYDFSKLSSIEIESKIKNIITEKKILYPDYEFEISEGKFLINVE